MKNKINFKLYIVSLLTLFIASCEEDDNKVTITEPDSVTITEFFNINDSFNEYQTVAEKAFLSKENVENLSLGALATAEDVQAVYNSIDADIISATTPFKLANFESDAGVPNLFEVVDGFAIKKEIIEVELVNYFENFKNRIEAQKQLAIDNGEDPNEVTAADVFAPSFDIANTGVYTVSDLLNSTNNSLTVFAPHFTAADRADRDISKDLAEPEDREEAGQFLLGNILSQRLTFDQLVVGEVYTTLSGTTITISDNVLEQRFIAGEKPTKAINGDDSIIRLGLRDIDAKSTGIIHAVTALIPL